MSIKTNINRRDFLKGVSATSVVLSFMPGTLGAFSGEVKGSSKFVPSICEMCSTRCPIEARVDTLQEAQKVFIQGNPYSTSTWGAICARGGSGVNQLFDPNRLVNPIMRTGERGDGKWKEIS